MLKNEIFSLHSDYNFHILADGLKDDVVIISATQTGGACVGSTVSVPLPVYEAKELATGILHGKFDEVVNCYMNQHFDLEGKTLAPISVYEYAGEDGSELQIYHCVISGWVVKLCDSIRELSVPIQHSDFCKWGQGLEFAVNAWNAARYVSVCLGPA